MKIFCWSPIKAVAVLGALFTLALGGCAGTRPRPDTLTVTILHTNDIHAHWGGLTPDRRPCYAPLCEGGQGGTVRLAQAVASFRHGGLAPLLLDAGDQFQGTLFFTLHQERMAAEALNRLAYDAFVPGNHEFDLGCGRFEALAKALAVPVLGANLEFREDSGANPAPWRIVERNGRQIGIIGLVNPDTPTLSSPCPEAVFSTPDTALRKSAAALDAEGIDIIIAVTHLGIDEDRRLARTVNGVDLFVGGHSHSLLSNTLPKAVGPYPLVERSPAGDPVLVVTAGYGGSLLGKIEVTFDQEGKALAWSGEPLLLDSHTLAELDAGPADEALVKAWEAYAAPVQKLMRTPLGRIVSDIPDGHPLETPDVLCCRSGECRSGNLVADAMLAQSGLGAQIALLNGGALRNSFPAGTVTVGDVIGVFPFEDHLAVAELPGAILLQALEQGLSRHGQGGGGFLQVAGLRYAFDPFRKPGARLLSTSIQGMDGRWRPLNPEATYRVATVSYLAEGGDGFSLFTKLDWRNTTLKVGDGVRNYLSARSSLTVRIEGRITKVAAP
ncbi:MAG: bifunctional metallophosphatase/5'-nucleotidase [Deltaproteobacteria bacterium]|nr:bifunctional metallophosphatase/5'-nucleotidase [Deltaproteobacteria bacterium]